ncbi:glycosyltransferase [Spirosoma linguale]|uniref:Glycosyl transferase group 1 n=1 Tax=Spirosoma linguale (strain ATCC 33905 / DSM 74 / LMG 10896 / Claus 1) TaxID=504472 RepID=D2QKU1_SPILD|nr:glycosyl transferase group 1 [Spirosoma linguale DSM 74]
MRVTLLSTYQSFGGAAVAATRLHRALQKYPASLATQPIGSVESTMLIGTPNRLDTHKPAPGVSFLANNFLAEQTAFGRFVAERLAFLPYERDPSVRFQFSPARFGAGLTFHPAIQQTDVIHLHWINFGFMSLNGLRALIDLGKPIVWTLHDQWAFTGGCHYTHGCPNFQTHCHHCPYLKKPGAQDLSYQIFEKKLRLFTDSNIHFVSPSRWLADEGRSSTLLGNLPFTVIPNTVDQTLYRPLDRAEAANRFDLPDTGKPRLLFGSANITDTRKGFRYFAEALTLLHQQHPALTPEVLVFGKGRSYLLNELPYPVRHLGLLTTEDDIAAAYNAADALVVPSLEDNLPNTVVEAMACGTPVVGFRTGGIPEMIDHETNGYLADVGSAQQLADGLAFILTHSGPNTLRQSARQSAEARFSEDVVARQHVELYSQLVKLGARSEE